MNHDFYIAEKNGAGVEVSTVEEMDKALEEGYRIIKLSDDTETVMADPDHGWLKDKPVILGPKICRSSAVEAVDALNVILGEA